MKPQIVMDFETKSDIDLSKAGSVKYLNGKDADIICLGYKIEDEPTELWIPGHDLPDCVKNPDNYTWVAHNAQFDFHVWHMIGAIKYNFPSNRLQNWVDTMALCGRFTYPQALEKAGKVLELNIQKNPRGKALIKKICCPPFQYTHSELFEFYEYCKDDVRTTKQLLQALPASALSEDEQRIWMLTARMNLHGLPVDVKAAKQIYKLTEIYKEEQNKLLPSLTDGVITKATQAARIKKWLNNKGIKAANLQAATVETLLERLDLKDDVRTVLTLRKELGRSSTAKFLKVIDQEYKGRIYMNQRYYGANTGRWAGMGFQLHNLPRSKVTDAQPIIDSFFDLSILEGNPIDAAKSIVRGMICAPPGYRIAAADYSSIENRILAWVAHDVKTVQLFEDGLDQYIDMASFLYKVAYDQVTEDQRQFGKIIILGCGFGLGWKGFQKKAAEFGIFLTDAKAKAAVDAYRAMYPLVKSLWYRCHNAAIAAVRNPGTEFPVNDIVYKVIADRNKTAWLQCKLPSSRNLYYNKPHLHEDDFGIGVSAWGINPYSKQWMPLKIIPGRYVENVVQALARDVLASGKLNLDHAKYKVIGSIHDEALCEVHKDNDCLKDICDLMCINPPWATGLPLAAAGMVEKRYRKM